MKVKGTCGIWMFSKFLIILTLLGDVSMIPEVYWGVGATHLVRCGELHT